MEIHIDILKAAAEGRQKPTHIMYRANLTWTRLKNHLEFLIAQNLLVEETTNGSTTYSLTTTGKEVIAYYKRIERETRLRKKGTYSKAYVLAHKS